MKNSLAGKVSGYTRRVSKWAAENTVLFILAVALLSSGATYALFNTAKNQTQNTGTAKQANERQTIANQTAKELSSDANSPAGTETSKNKGTQKSQTNSPPIVNQYSPPTCTKTILNYTTTYKLANYGGAGQTSSSGGVNGYVSTCTADSNGFKPEDSTIRPIDRTIYVSTGGVGPGTPSINTTEPYESVYSRVQTVCNELSALTNNDPTAMQWCKVNIFNQIMRYHNESYVR